MFLATSRVFGCISITSVKAAVNGDLLQLDISTFPVGPLGSIVAAARSGTWTEVSNGAVSSHY